MSDLKEARELVRRVAAGLRVGKVVATRSVKGQRGDTFLGFSAAFQTVQEDGGQGLVGAMEEGEEPHSVTTMTLREASIAAILLGRTVDLAAHRNARAGGNISAGYCEAACAAITSNYGQLLAEVMGELPSPEQAKKP